MRCCISLALVVLLAAPSFQADINLFGWGRSQSTTKARCSADQFQCRTGECIRQTYVCDGDRDCPAGEDERNCPAAGGRPGSATTQRSRGTTSADDETCTSAEFDCGRGGAGRYGRCIPNSPTFICDGTNDCANGADERNCRGTTTESPSRGTCKSGEFRCSSGRCLRPNWVCDGDEDCSDGADERNCKGVTAARRTTPTTRRQPSSRLTSTTLQLKPHYVNGLKVIASRRSELFSKSAPTKEACGELCSSSRAKCRLVSYDKNRKTCTGYSEDIEARFAFDEDFTSYGHWTETARRYQGATVAGQDITFEGQPLAEWLKISWTEQVCMQVCHIHPKCDLALFNTKTNKCALKEADRDAQPTPSANFVALVLEEEPGSPARSPSSSRW